MKKISLLILVLCVFKTVGGFGAGQTANGGDLAGNGGDICEDRIKIIRDDLKSWIEKGGAEGLQLPPEITLDEYKQRMLEQISLAKVTCSVRPVMIDGSEKTCENYFANDGSSVIRCNTKRFMSTDQSDQYVLVHHEYAGLSQLEVNDEDGSHYEISNQISGYLEDQIVKKLVVKPGNGSQPKPLGPFDSEMCAGSPMPFEQKKKLFDRGEAISRAIPLTIAVRSRQCTDISGCGDWKVPERTSYRSIIFTVLKDLYPSDEFGHEEEMYRVFNSLTDIDQDNNFRMRFLPDGSLQFDFDTGSLLRQHVEIHSKDNGGQVSFREGVQGSIILAGQPLGLGRKFPDDNELPNYIVEFNGILTDHCIRMKAANRLADFDNPYIWHESEAVIYSQF